MGFNSVTATRLSRLSEFVAERIGLNFPPERWTDLERGVESAAAEFGFENFNECADWLLSASLTREQLQALASHLTVGETYFFREPKTFEALGDRILPELIASRRNQERRLRIWSAGCCTGEEPYSLAILLQQLLPDLKDWQVTILGTDINAQFLQKASAGIYGEWSFRAAPSWLKGRCFTPVANRRYAIRPEIKKLVTFAPLNLAEHIFPSLTTDTNAMDLIFCRNVLMYFTPAQARKVIDHLRQSLVENGWLVVSSSEASQTTLARFAPVNFPGAILYRKSKAPKPRAEQWTPTSLAEIAPWPPPDSEPAWAGNQPAPEVHPEKIEGAKSVAHPVSKNESTPETEAEKLYQDGRYAEVVETLLAALIETTAAGPRTFSLLARALANQGKLTDALAWCDRWIAAYKLDPSGHYLRAVVLQELGDHEQAGRSLQRVLYLEPAFVLAHFASGNAARSAGKNAEADKHFANTLKLLRGYPTDELLPECDGLTAGRLREMVSSILEMEAAS